MCACVQRLGWHLEIVLPVPFAGMPPHLICAGAFHSAAGQAGVPGVPAELTRELGGAAGGFRGPPGAAEPAGHAPPKSTGALGAVRTGQRLLVPALSVAGATSSDTPPECKAAMLLLMFAFHLCNHLCILLSRGIGFNIAAACADCAQALVMAAVTAAHPTWPPAAACT